MRPTGKDGDGYHACSAPGFAALPTGAAVEVGCNPRKHQLKSQILFLNIWIYLRKSFRGLSCKKKLTDWQFGWHTQRYV